MTNDHNLPRWAVLLALRAAQLIQENPPETAVCLTLRQLSDGQIEVVTPRTEVLKRPLVKEKLDTNGRSV